MPPAEKLALTARAELAGSGRRAGADEAWPEVSPSRTSHEIAEDAVGALRADRPVRAPAGCDRVPRAAPGSDKARSVSKSREVWRGLDASSARPLVPAVASAPLPRCGRSAPPSPTPPLGTLCRDGTSPGEEATLRWTGPASPGKAGSPEMSTTSTALQKTAASRGAVGSKWDSRTGSTLKATEAGSATAAGAMPPACTSASARRALSPASSTVAGEELASSPVSTLGHPRSAQKSASAASAGALAVTVVWLTRRASSAPSCDSSPNLGHPSNAAVSEHPVQSRSLPGSSNRVAALSSWSPPGSAAEADTST
mmetsp:Transcript_24274/g.91609  ORF Transcript_24274/g.91609 Transcript_24274/m.91609 type:complete len:312 (-) Transcript_24274:2441-3376(-)